MADNILRVGTEFDVGPLVAGAKAAGMSIDDLAARLRAQGLSAADTTSALVNMGIGQKDAAAAAESAGASFKKSAEASDAENIAQTETISSSNELALAIAALSKEINNLAAAKQNVTRASGGMTNAMGAARTEMGLVEGSAGMMAGGLARVAAQSSLLAPLITAAFPVVAAIALIDILGQVVSAFEKAADSAAGYTKAVQEAEKEDVKASDAALSHAATLREALEKQAEIIKEQGGLAQETFGDKWRNALDASTAATARAEGPLASLKDALIATAKDPLSPFEALVGSIEGLYHAEGKAADEAVKLEKAQRAVAEEAAKFAADTDKQALKLVEAREAADKSAVDVGAASAAEARVKSVQIEIAALAQKQRLEEDIAAKEIAAKGGTPVDQSSERARVAQEYEYKQIELANNLKEAQIKAADEVAKEQERLARENAEGQKKLAEDLAKAKMPEADRNQELFVSTYGITEMQKRATEVLDVFRDIHDKEEAAAKELASKQLDDQIESTNKEISLSEEKSRAEVENDKRSFELRRVTLSQYTAEVVAAASNEYTTKAANYAKEIALINAAAQAEIITEEQKQKKLDAIWAEEDKAYAKMVADQKKATDEAALAMQKYVTTVTNELNKGLQLWMTQHITFAQAMMQVWRQVAEGAIMNLAKLSEQEALALIEHKALLQQQIIMDAKAAASGAFHWVMATVPFPADLILAPVAAAAAFAGVMAFGAFEKGGIVPETGMAMVHTQEMVLPANISKPLQAAIPSIQNFNMAMQRDSGVGPVAGGHTTTITRGDTNVTINHQGTQLSHADIVKAVSVAMRRGELRSIP